MKKSLVFIAFALLLFITGMLFFGLFNTYGFDREDEKMTLFLNSHRFIDDDDLTSYEFIYLHLSTQDQDIIDLDFAGSLMNADFEEKTITEVMRLIDDIKSEIIDTYQFDDTYQRYGMMGGSMMGYRNNQPTPCLYSSRVNSYEWIYIHLSELEQYEMDHQFAEAMMLIDMNTYTIEELVTHIRDVKQNLLVSFN
jgi:hypothetical protein